MRRILFVDDDPNILQGMNRMLYPMRGEWQMAFVTSGEDALAALEECPFNVIVSDMKMPRMSGADLLKRVQSRFPEVARIILSGQSERETILNLINVSHVYLAKPCDSENLKYAIARTCALRDLLSGPALRRLATALDSIPSLPSAFVRVRRAIEVDTASLAEIAEIVSGDMGMSAAVLHVANAAWLGIPRKLSNVREAISFLGLDNLQALIVTTHMFSQIPKDRVRQLSLEGLWDFSAQVALYARQIAKFQGLGAKEIDTVSMSGFLLSTGTLLLALNLPDKYRKAQVEARRQRVPTWQAERQIFGASHAELAAYVLSLWGLPADVVDAVAWSHTPALFPTESLSPALIVHVALAFAHEALHRGPASSDAAIDAAAMARLGLHKKVDAWRIVCMCEPRRAA